MTSITIATSWSAALYKHPWWHVVVERIVTAVDTVFVAADSVAADAAGLS